MKTKKRPVCVARAWILVIKISVIFTLIMIKNHYKVIIYQHLIFTCTRKYEIEKDIVGTKVGVQQN